MYVNSSVSWHFSSKWPRLQAHSVQPFYFQWKMTWYVEILTIDRTTGAQSVSWEIIDPKKMSHQRCPPSSSSSSSSGDSQKPRPASQEATTVAEDHRFETNLMTKMVTCILSTASPSLFPPQNGRGWNPYKLKILWKWRLGNGVGTYHFIAQGGVLDRMMMWNDVMILNLKKNQPFCKEDWLHFVGAQLGHTWTGVNMVAIL